MSFTASVKWAFYFAFTALWTLVLFPIAIAILLVTFSPDASMWLARRVWAPVLVWMGATDVKIDGREHLKRGRPMIFVSNHQSTVDIPILLSCIPYSSVRFLAKSQLQWVPFVGWYMWLAGFIWVDRKDREKAIRSLAKGARSIRNGTSLIVFPEGTRSADAIVLPFKKGSFALALKAMVPVCPVTVEGSGKMMPKNSWNITRTPLRVRIGEPIDPAPYALEEDIEGLMRYVRDVIIRQSLELGGKGGDPDDFVAAAGFEGIGRSRPLRHAPSDPPLVR